MQQARKKKYASHLSVAAAPAEKKPGLSSFSVVHRFGKLEIVKVLPEPVKSDAYFRFPDLPGWSMPPVPIGYIKCKRFDFL